METQIVVDWTGLQSMHPKRLTFVSLALGTERHIARLRELFIVGWIKPLVVVWSLHYLLLHEHNF